jgi:hypothetical protein
LYICANFNSIDPIDLLALLLLLSTRSSALSAQAEVFQVIRVNAQSIRGFFFHVALRIGTTNNRVAVAGLSEKQWERTAMYQIQFVSGQYARVSKR